MSTLVTLALERRPDEGQPVTVGNLPTMFVRVDSATKRTPAGGTAGVIGFNVWMTAVDSQFQKAMDEYRQSDGVVIDLRGNPLMHLPTSLATLDSGPGPCPARERNVARVLSSLTTVAQATARPTAAAAS